MLKNMAAAIGIGCLAACASRTPPPGDAAPARPTLRSGIDLQYVDASTRPQDDVYQYLNGKWLRNYQLPPDKGAVGSFTAVQDRTEEQLRSIVDSLEQTAGQRGSRRREAGRSVRELHERGATRDLGGEAPAAGVRGHRCGQGHEFHPERDGADGRNRSRRAVWPADQPGRERLHAVRGHPASERLGPAGSRLLPEGRRQAQGGARRVSDAYREDAEHGGAGKGGAKRGGDSRSGNLIGKDSMDPGGKPRPHQDLQQDGAFPNCRR